MEDRLLLVYTRLVSQLFSHLLPHNMKDRIFVSNTKTSRLYNEFGRKIVTAAMEGINGMQKASWYACGTLSDSVA